MAKVCRSLSAAQITSAKAMRARCAGPVQESAQRREGLALGRRREAIAGELSTVGRELGAGQVRHGGAAQPGEGGPQVTLVSPPGVEAVGGGVKGGVDDDWVGNLIDLIDGVFRAVKVHANIQQRL